MSLLDFLFYVCSFFILVVPVCWLAWRISCFFKKTCRWKSCPYRKKYFEPSSFDLGANYCKKFPPTEEEMEEYNQMLDKLLDMTSKK